nr:immunoglobulin heavy chain junction region [Mus musculus]
CTHLFLAYW